MQCSDQLTKLSGQRLVVTTADMIGRQLTHEEPLPISPWTHVQVFRYLHNARLEARGGPDARVGLADHQFYRRADYT